MNVLPVVILAGGLGTRLLPATVITPKVLIPILGKPFLAWKLEGLVRQGVDEIYLLLGSGSEQVRDFLDSYITPLRVHVFTDGEQLLGTAGAIRKNIDNLPEAFILTFGDNLLDFSLSDLSEMYLREKKSIMVCTTYREPEQNFNVRISGSFVDKYEKYDNSDCIFMDYGYSVFELNVFEKLELAQPHDLEKILQDLIFHQRLIAMTTDLEYFEIGTPAGLQRTKSWLNRCNQ